MRIVIFHPRESLTHRLQHYDLSKSDFLRRWMNIRKNLEQSLNQLVGPVIQYVARDRVYGSSRVTAYLKDNIRRPVMFLSDQRMN